MSKLEILAPAGGIESVYPAVRMGADAVYIGMKKFFRTTIHHTAAGYDTIFFSGGRRGFQIELPLSSLKKVIEFELADLIK